jgi:uncharacterized protein (TIGR02145 family)
MKYVVVFFIGLIASSRAPSQTGYFVDTRDGSKYETIVISSKQWFREHLRFNSRNSHFARTGQNEVNGNKGNYYSNYEIDSICPPGWQVATTDDWQEFIDLFIKANHIPAASIKNKQLPSPNNSTVVTIPHFKLLEDTLLKLNAIGWVQGKKITNRQTLSLWLSDKKTDDNKYHVHVGELGYVVHTHSHHIIDKPGKIRKFAVRGVCELRKHE